MTTPGHGSVSYLCPRCHAALTAQADDAGQRQTCPHCGKTRQGARLPTPSPTQPPAVSPPEAAKPTPAPSVAGIANIAVLCPVCGTRMYATREQAGKSMVCPDCLETVPVPAAVPRHPRGQAPTVRRKSSTGLRRPTSASDTGGESLPHRSQAGRRAATTT